MTPEPKIIKLPKAVPNDRDEQGHLKKPVSFPNINRTRGDPATLMADPSKGNDAGETRQPVQRVWRS